MPNYHVLDVPRTFHAAQPEQQRPKIKMFKDAWFWAYWIAVMPAFGFVVLMTALEGIGADEGALLVGLSLMMAEIAVVAFIISRLKIAAGSPKRMMVLAVLWGLSGAMTLTLAIAFSVTSFVEKMGWYTFAASFAGAYPEEITKALGIWMVLSIGRAWWNRPWHGIVAGMLVGLGFDAYENLLYGLSVGLMHPTSDVNGMLETFLVRNLFGAGLHIIFCGFVGFGIGQAMFAARKMETNGQPGQERSATWRLGQVLLWGFVGFASHFAFNVQLQGVSVVVQYGWAVAVWAVSLAGLVALIVWQTRVLRPALQVGAYPSVTLYQKAPVGFVSVGASNDAVLPPAWPAPKEAQVASPPMAPGVSMSPPSSGVPMSPMSGQPQSPQRRGAQPDHMHHVDFPKEWE